MDDCFLGEVDIQAWEVRTYFAISLDYDLRFEYVIARANFLYLEEVAKNLI